MIKNVINSLKMSQFHIFLKKLLSFLNHGFGLEDIALQYSTVFTVLSILQYLQYCKVFLKHKILCCSFIIKIVQFYRW